MAQQSRSPLTPWLALFIMLPILSAPAFAQQNPMCIVATGVNGQWELFNSNMVSQGYVTEMQRIALPAPPSEFNGSGIAPLVKLAMDLKKSNGSRIYAVVGAPGAIPAFGPDARPVMIDPGALSATQVRNHIQELWAAAAASLAPDDEDSGQSLFDSDTSQPFCGCVQCKNFRTTCLNSASNARWSCDITVAIATLACVFAAPNPLTKALCLTAALSALQDCYAQYQADVANCWDEYNDCMADCL